jgi:hypothetical protein
VLGRVAVGEGVRCRSLTVAGPVVASARIEADVALLEDLWALSHSHAGKQSACSSTRQKVCWPLPAYPLRRMDLRRPCRRDMMPTRR